METKHLNERGKMFLESKHLADCTFNFPNWKFQIKANRTLLALASPIMDRMFFGRAGYVESETATVDLHDIDPNAFEKFLSWVYAKELNLESVDEAISVHQIADKYAVMDLALICEQYVVKNVTLENIGLCWKFGHLHNQIEINEKVMKLIRRQTTTVLESPNFLTSDVNMMLEILEQNELWIVNEMTLVEALDRYAEINSLDRKRLDAAIKCIRFKVVDAEKFIKLKSVLLTDEEKNAIVANLISSNASISYPEGFSESIIPRCTDYTRISECDERLLKCVKESHYSGEELMDYLNYDERYSEGTIADLLFTDLGWHTDLKINAVLREHLPRKTGEDNNNYMTRILEDDNPRIIAALISCLKCFCFPDYLDMEDFDYES